MKALIRKFLRSQGYDICHVNQAGKNPFHDLRKIFGARKLKVVFDVGANEGQTAVECATTFPAATIHCFEPFDQAFESLVQASKPFINIKPVKAAVGEIPDTRTLFVNKFSPTNSLLQDSRESSAFVPEGLMANTGTVQVEMITLDDYCANTKIEFIDLLKMDVQGYEQRVLRGVRRMLEQEKVPAILTEVLFTPLYNDQTYFHDLYADLWQHGFRLTGLYNPALNEQHFLSWSDALFVHPRVLAGRLTA
jgi:FkbM family methyltransferase